MSHLCECGHSPGDHYAETGQCEAYDATAADWPCLCDSYKWEGDQ